VRKKERRRLDSENSERSVRAARRKEKKSTNSEISTFLDKTDSSIATESIPDVEEDDDDDAKTVDSDLTTRSRM